MAQVEPCSTSVPKQATVLPTMRMGVSTAEILIHRIN